MLLFITRLVGLNSGVEELRARGPLVNINSIVGAEVTHITLDSLSLTDNYMSSVKRTTNFQRFFEADCSSPNKHLNYFMACLDVAYY